MNSSYHILNFKSKRVRKKKLIALTVLIGNLFFARSKINDIKTEDHSNIASLTQKKVVSNQEFVHVDNSSRTVSLGDERVLNFQRVNSENSRSDLDHVIFVQDFPRRRWL